MSHLPLRLASLGLAALLWFAIAAETRSEMGLVVPVELQTVPRDLELTGDVVNSVEVRLRASPGVLQRLTPADVSAQLDLAGIAEGERIMHLTPETIRAPFGVRVVRVSPSIITLNFERTQQKVVPVRPRIIGRPARGYEVAEVLAEPAEIRIAGPKSRVQEIESAFTEAISIEGARADVRDEAGVGLDDPVLRVVGAPRAQVTARIREESGRRTFPALAVEARGATARLQPRAVDVVVEGPLSALQRLAATDVRVWVEASRLRAGARVSVSVELAPGFEGVSVQRVDPAEVVVRAAGR
jgi:YbbR domain-containing protein